MNCLHCGAETSNGLALCELSQMAAAKLLEFLPVYFRNLARWRPGRAGSRPVPGSRLPSSLSSAADDRVSRALDEAGNALTTWARKLTEDRDIEPPLADGEAAQMAALCRWFAENLTTVATLDWCGEFICNDAHEKGAECDGLGHHEQRLRNLTMDVAPGWYAGECHLCEAPTYVIPGLTWVTCRGCGATTYARDHLETILDEARGWVARPMRLAEAIVALVDGELSVPRLHKRISKWGERKQIAATRRVDRDGDPCGPKCFRLGEVIDLLFVEGATRTSERDDDTSKCA
jgi:hypothetical protein